MKFLNFVQNVFLTTTPRNHCNNTTSTKPTPSSIPSPLPRASLINTLPPTFVEAADAHSVNSLETIHTAHADLTLSISAAPCPGNTKMTLPAPPISTTLTTTTNTATATTVAQPYKNSNPVAKRDNVLTAQTTTTTTTTTPISNPTTTVTEPYLEAVVSKSMATWGTEAKGEGGSGGRGGGDGGKASNGAGAGAASAASGSARVRSIGVLEWALLLEVVGMVVVMGGGVFE